MRALSVPLKVSAPIFPYIALGFGVLSLGLSGIFVRWSQADGPVTSFYRMFFATLLLTPVMIFHLRRAGMPRARLSRARWLIFPLVGGMFTALDHGAWSTAIAYTKVANATLLNNVAPLWVALFAALVWRERLAGWFWVGLSVTLLGAAVFMGSDLAFSPDLTTGNLIGLFSSVFYAGYFLITQRGRRFLDTMTYVWLTTMFAALFLLAGSQVMRQPLTGFDSSTWLVFLVAALMSQIGGYFSVVYALGRLPASIVSPTMILQPVLSALLAIPLAGEMLAPLQWLGGLAVVGGIYLVNASRVERV